MNGTSLAYALLALCYLCPEAQRCAKVLRIDIPDLNNRHNFYAYVGGEKERLLSMIETAGYGFTFRSDGCIHRVYKVGWEGYYVGGYQELVAQQRSELNAQTVRRTALEWLAALDVDTNQLERAYRYEIMQPELGKGASKKSVPEFIMNWSKKTLKSQSLRSFGAKVEILGVGSQLLQLSIEDRSLCRRKPVTIPGEGIVMNLPDELFTNLWASRGFSASNVFKILHTSTAYQGVMLSNMMLEANRTIAQLGLRSALRPHELADSFVTPPEFGPRGSLKTAHCLFEFDQSGNVSYFCYVRDGLLGPSQDGSAAYYERTSRLPSLVNSNSVIQVAEDCLRSIGIDTDKLRKAATPVSTRYFIGKKPTHIWWVSWWNRAAQRDFAYVQIDGTTREPQRIRLNDQGFRTHLGPKVKNAQELMAMPDPEPQRDPLRAHLNVWPQLFQ